MRDTLADVFARGSGLATAGVGGNMVFDVATMSDVIGIVAAIVGTICTVLLTYWRYKDHKRRKKDAEVKKVQQSDRRSR